MLVAALAVMAAKCENRGRERDVLASMLDFSDTGDIGLFIDEASVAVRERRSAKGGIMPVAISRSCSRRSARNDLVCHTWSTTI